MREWKSVEINQDTLVGLTRKFHRGCGRKNMSAADRKKFVIMSVKYRTDGYTTQTEVLVGEPNGENPILATGYGAAVRSITDAFNEKRGISESLNRAFEGAATVLRHKLINRANHRP